ncbi:phototropin-1-like [Rosa rugosa]|uniref:phototropin-1-like n=1 Tax=Rosa rugosa TaxID=74645 RepID=UPI002B41679B|nr:phototropin-1-like [Rosa rugosa]
MATHSVTELVQAVRRPRSLSESTNLPFRKSGGGGRGEKTALFHGGYSEKSNSKPRLPDNPIIFASNSFLELTEYSCEEILGRNCRFLQGPETDPATVKKIREAIDNQTDVTVQLINYTKSGKKFWNVFHLQLMRDQKGEVQYFIGVQLDGSQHIEPLHNSIPEVTVKESEKLVKETAVNVDEAARELPDANMKPEDLWMNHSKVIHPKPHRRDSPPWRAIQKILDSGEQIRLKHFKPIKPLGSGDTTPISESDNTYQTTTNILTVV